MSEHVSAVIICEPEYAPGQFVLLRVNAPYFTRQYAWCGRSMGWRPFKTTSNAYFKRFSSYEAAEEAADKYVNLPLQEE